MPDDPNLREIISQFADDTTLMLVAQEEVLQELINTLEEFKNNTGLKANYHKTTIFKLGPAQTAKKLKTTAEFRWEQSNINLLGILLDLDKVENSYEGTTDRIEAITNMWKKRNLSLIGKITMLNSLVGALLVYKMQVLPSIDKNLVVKINRIVENFIWNGRKPKLKLAVLQGECEDGGLGLFDLEKRDAAFKITWLGRLINLPPNMQTTGRECLIRTRLIRSST